MKIIAKLALSSLAFTCLNSVAAPVEYDTPDAHIVVIRPMDQWTPDQSEVAKLRDAKRFSNTYSGSYFLDQKKSVGLDELDDQFSKYFASKYPEKKYDKRNSVLTTIMRPITMTPDDMSQLFNTVNAQYEAFAISSRKPVTPPAEGGGRPFGAIADGLAGSGVFGTIGAVGFGLLGAIFDNPIKINTEINTAPPPVAKPAKIDYSQYKYIDFRWTESGALERGQIIIAYKTEKTQAAEDEALAIGLASTLGFDTTKEATMASRAADLADRQAIWDKCVADGKCKNEE